MSAGSYASLGWHRTSSSGWSCAANPARSAYTTCASLRPYRGTSSRREAAVEELEGHEQSDLLDRHKEANQLEFELGRLESDLDDVREEIESVEEDLAERDRLTERREELQTELADLRTRIEQLETEAVEAFKTALADARAAEDHLRKVLTEGGWLQ